MLTRQLQVSSLSSWVPQDSQCSQIVRALTFITYLSGLSQDFLSLRDQKRDEEHDPWPLTLSRGRRQKMQKNRCFEQFSDLTENINWKKISNMNPHHLMRARRSSSERAPAPEESRTGRSPSPRSQIFPGSLPPAWCCCSNASSRVPRGAHWSGDWTQRTCSCNLDQRSNVTNRKSYASKKKK